MKNNKKLWSDGWMKEFVYPIVLGVPLFLGALGLSVHYYNRLESPNLEQSVKQEEQDLPCQTVCQRYAKSGLAGILAIGRAKDLDPVSKETYREQYEEMVALYDSLAGEYKIDHPDYQSKTFLRSDVVFGD
jgi:hypothetical protein